MSIQEILEDHLRVRGVRGLDTLCICGWHTSQRLRPEDLHRSHLAEVLDKYMQERILSWQEHAYLVGYAQANEDIENGAEYPSPNPYKEEK